MAGTLQHKVVGMIFAAGKGTRLVPFTHTMPKALVPVGDVPMLRRVIERFAKAGITDIVINIHHFADKIREYLTSNNNFGLNIMLSDESDNLLDTGGGILKARTLLSDADAIFVHNVDILTDMDINAMLDCHFASNNIATLLVADRNSSRYLYFGTDDNLLRGWRNIKTDAVLPADFAPDDTMYKAAFGGVHVLSPRIFAALAAYTSDPAFSLTPFYAENCRRLAIGAFMPSTAYYWFDIGTPEKLEIAEKALNKMSL